MAGLKAAFRAADRGDEAFFRKNLETDWRAARDNDNCTVLHRACRNGQTALVRYLVAEAKFSVEDSTRAKSPLYEAACYGHVDTVSELIRLHADIFRSKFNEWNPLHVSSCKGFLHVVRVLLDAVAANSGSEPCRALLEARNKEGSTALSLAAREGQADIVAELLRRGANANNKNHNQRTPLLSAIGSGSPACVQALVDSGKCSFAEEDLTDSSGANIMHEAACLDNAAVIEYLLSGVPLSRQLVERRDKAGRTPLHLSALNGKSIALRALLRLSPALRDEKDSSGATPLLLAAVRGHSLACFVLVQFGADPEPCIAPARSWKRHEVLVVLERRQVVLKDVELVDTVGMGTYKLGENTYEAVLYYLSKGHRVLDMAEFYGNEAEVGRAIRDSKRDRKELFLISKVWNSNTSRGLAAQAVDGMLGRLAGVGYLDLVLVHWPCKGFERAFGDLMECRSRGLVRYVGSSNFLPEHCERVFTLHGEWPALNQIEVSAFFFRKEQITWFQQRGIVVQSYRSLGVEGFVNKTFHASMDHLVVQRIAAETGCTPAQVLLRWCLQHSICIIPKSRSSARIDENLNVFRFNLSGDQMRALDDLTHPELEAEWMQNVFKPSSEKDVA